MANNIPPRAPRPAVLMGSSNQLTIMFDDAVPYDWMLEGMKVTGAAEASNGELHLTVEHDKRPNATRPRRPSSGSGWRYQVSSTAFKQLRSFRMTSARLTSLSPGVVSFILPAERQPLAPKAAISSKHKAKAVVSSPPTALATLKDTVKSMAHESPPPNFRPAIPLREAIDTVNAYVLEEGDALKLTVSKRGRLKVEYEYGG